MTPEDTPRTLAHLTLVKDGPACTALPWDFISPADAERLLRQAYRVTTWLQGSPQALAEHVPRDSQRRRFAECLLQSFEEAVNAHALTHGGFILFYGGSQPDAAQRWAEACAEVPASWQPCAQLQEVPACPPKGEA